jgi:hypothetical protein
MGYRVRSPDRTACALGSLILATTIVRLVFAFRFYGFFTGDDLEILQAGFRRAFGWPYRPWEIRNLLVPDLLVAPALRIAAALGVTSTRTLVALASVPFVLLASLNVWLVFRLARRWLASDAPALLAATLYALHWIPLGFGSTVYPRTASTTCVLLGTWLLAAARGGLWRGALAGGLVAAAFAIRYSEAIFLIPMLAVLWLEDGTARTRLARCAALLAGFSGLALLTAGVEDWLTWGRPFASLIAFARFTLLERRSSSLVVGQPWYWFFWRLPKWLPVTLLPFLWRARANRALLPAALYALLPLLLLSGVHHKEMRYLQGIVPFVVLIAAAGAWSFWESGRRWPVAILCGASIALGLTGIAFLRDKSMAAVQAGEALAAVAQGQAVAVSQPWAYGGTLYLRPRIQVLELPYPLTATALEDAAARARWIALYRQDLRANPAFAALLGERGFTRVREFVVETSRPVVLYAAGDDAGSSGALAQSGVISTRARPLGTIRSSRAAP